MLKSLLHTLKSSKQEHLLPEIPHRLSIQSASALILLLSGVALAFVALFLPPVGVIDTSVIIVFAQILIAVGTFIGVDMRFMLKIYLAYFEALHKSSNSLLSDEKVSNQVSAGAEQAIASSEASE